MLGKRKTLISGSAPTENLLEKSHEAPKRERRPLVRKVDTPDIDQPSTSSQSGWPEPQCLNIQDFTVELKQKKIQPWKTDKSYEGEIRIELDDKINCIPKVLCCEFVYGIQNSVFKTVYLYYLVKKIY